MNYVKIYIFANLFNIDYTMPNFIQLNKQYNGFKNIQSFFFTG